MKMVLFTLIIVHVILQFVALGIELWENDVSPARISAICGWLVALLYIKD